MSRFAIFSILLFINSAPSAHAQCDTQLGDMQQCLSGGSGTTIDAPACVDCLAGQTPQTTSLDCTVSYNFVCTLADTCADSCGDACTDKIEAFGFCVSETFFQGCPQDCSAPPDSGTPDQLQNQTCSVYYNKVVSCLSANSGNSDAASANSETCNSCVGANPPPSSGDCSAASDYVCTVAGNCYQDCGSVCNDELFTFLQCQGDDVAGEQCTYDACDAAGNPVTNESGALAATTMISVIVLAAPIVFGILV